MKKILSIIGTIFIVMGFLQIIALSVVCGLDNVIYSGEDHFIGFMTMHGLWNFFYGAIFIIVIGVILLFLTLYKHQ